MFKAFGVLNLGFVWSLEVRIWNFNDLLWIRKIKQKTLHLQSFTLLS